MEVVEYATTKYGKPSALYRGYRFRCRRMGANGNKYWVCTRHDVKCKSTLTTDTTGEFVKWSGEHDHPPDIAKCEVTKAIASMRKRARDEPHIPVQQIYNAEAAKLTSNGLDFVTNIPRFHSVKHGLYYQRHLLMPNLPTQREDIVLEGVYTKTMDGKDFLAFDSQPQNRIVGYATADNLRLLCESTDVQCDGTFKTAPKLFHQLYTLHVSLGTGNNTETVPVMYALLPDKRKETYRELFKKINLKCEDLGLQFNPPKLRLDYEPAPISVVNELYPGCQLSGCNFYFNQCLWRKLQNVGLSVQYARKESVVREHVRSVAALPHLCPADVHEGWMALMEVCPTDEFPQLVMFNDYFVETQKKKKHIVTDQRLAVLKHEYDSGRRAVLNFLRAAGHLLKLE